MKEIRFKVADEWHRELKEAARMRGLGLAHLVRLLLRDFLRERLPEEEREKLG